MKNLLCSISVLIIVVSTYNLVYSMYPDTWLREAVQHGDLRVVQQVLACRTVNVQAIDKTTSLDPAAYYYEYEDTLLHLAAEYGHNEILKLLIAYGSDVNAKTINGYTPLHVATIKGHTGTVKLLIDCSADIHAKTLYGKYKSLHITSENGYTSLHIAADKGHEAIVKLLVDHGACLHERLTGAGVNRLFLPVHQDATPLDLAASAGHKNIVQFLLDCGADHRSRALNSEASLYSAVFNGRKEIIELLFDYGASDEAALHFAAMSGNKELVQCLLNRGVNVNCKDELDETPLYKVAYSPYYYGHKVIELLLKHGADVTIRSKDTGMTPLHIAVFNGHCAVAEALINYGADIESTEDDSNDEEQRREMTPLIRAANEGHYDMVKLLLKHGAQVDRQDNYEDTALSLAVARGDSAIAKLLINHGAAIDGITPDNSPLLEALSEHNSYIAALLLDKGAIIPMVFDASDLAILNQIQRERQQLMNALMSNNPAEVKKLLKKGVYANAAAQLKLYQWYQALTDAIDSDTIERVKKLNKRGLSLALQESNGDTLLHRAVRKESVQVIKYLLSEGIDPTLVNNNGETAVHLAAGRPSILELFFNHYKQLSKPNTLPQERAYKKLV